MRAFAWWIGMGVVAAGAAAARAADGDLLTLRESTGPIPPAILPEVMAFQGDLGLPLNGQAVGEQASGRREVNWDGVPDADAAPSRLPKDYFNAIASTGLILSGDAMTQFQVCADAVNPSLTPATFGHLNASYQTAFATYSAQRLLAPLNTNVFEVRFVVAGTDREAGVSGFGAVFTDVDLPLTTRVEYFAGERLLLSRDVLASPGDGTFSFVGATFEGFVVTRVRITCGQAALGANDVTQTGGNPDVVAIDDMLFGEPHALGCDPDAHELSGSLCRIERLDGLLAAALPDGKLSQKVRKQVQKARSELGAALGLGGDATGKAVRKRLKKASRALGKVSKKLYSAAAVELVGPDEHTEMSELLARLASDVAVLHRRQE